MLAPVGLDPVYVYQDEHLDGRAACADWAPSVPITRALVAAATASLVKSPLRMVAHSFCVVDDGCYGDQLRWSGRASQAPWPVLADLILKGASTQRDDAVKRSASRPP
ncbi:MAG: hypothetical protein LC777_03340, partial [Actinobacteria bacterium]|nr:hypothetical protein [Actinomycetota bacterium]